MQINLKEKLVVFVRVCFLYVTLKFMKIARLRKTCTPMTRLSNVNLHSMCCLNLVFVNFKKMYTLNLLVLVILC